jgi:hypothetical protein
MRQQLLDINPEADVQEFTDGVTEDNIDAFLDGVDLFVEGFDFFVLEIRRRVFARCRELGIPAVTAAPLGMGTAYLLFTPDGMSFEDYFGFDDQGETQQYLKFLVGLAPAGLHRSALVDPSRIHLGEKRGPSTVMGCQLASGVVGAEAVKVLLNRGPSKPAPWYHQFDAYNGKFISRKLRGGHRHPLQRLKFKLASRSMAPQIAAHAFTVAAEVDTQETPLKQIISRARWAPSGDNSQPWTFRITGENSLDVLISPVDEANPYERGGRSTFLAIGTLLETMSLAAQEHDLTLDYSLLEDPKQDLVKVTFNKCGPQDQSPLATHIESRSTYRRPMLSKRLSADCKHQLEQSLGSDFEVVWRETRADKWQAIKLNMTTSKVFFGLRECKKMRDDSVHFAEQYPTRVLPIDSVGFSLPLRALIPWVEKSWMRTKVMNRYLMGWMTASLELDVQRGFASGALFSIQWKDSALPTCREDEVRAGRALQRFWLTAESLDLGLQPSYGAIAFATLTEKGTQFTSEAWALKTAKKWATHSPQFTAHQQPK